MKVISVIASFLLMLCLGGVYAWSIFVPLLKAELGFSSTQTQILIGSTLGIFALTMTVSGRLEQRFGPRLVASLSGFCLFLAYFLASKTQGEFSLLLLTISLLAGLATGFGYVVCLVVPAKNFPNHKGLAVGISLSGFGAGAILLSHYIKSLMEIQSDISILTIFFKVSLVYGMAALIAIPFLKYDRDQEKGSIQPSVSAISILSNPGFAILFFTLFSASFAGLLVLSNIKPLILSFSFSEKTATLGISLYAFGNMSGRVVYGYLVDKLGGYKTTISSFSGLIFFLSFLSFVPQNELFMYVILFGTGFSYGGFFILMPMYTASIFGVNQLGAVYPFVFLAYGLAGIFGPLSAGFLFDFSHSYQFSLAISILICCLGLYIFIRNRKLI